MPEFALPAGVTHLRTLKGPDAPLGGVAWSPDGSLVAAACKDGYTWVWEVETGALVMHLHGDVAGVRTVAFDLAGERLATGGDEGSIWIWETAGWKRILQLESGSCSALAFVSATTLVASGPTGTRLWDVPSGKVTRKLSGPQGSGTYVTADATGQVIAVWRSAVTTWRGDVAAVIHTRADSSDGPLDVAIHPGGQRVAVAEGDTIALYDVNGTLVATVEGHTDSIRRLAYSPDGALLASKSFNDVRLWDAASGELVAALPVTGSGNWKPGMAFHPTSATLAVVGSEPGSRIFDRRSEFERALDTTDRQLHLFALDPVRLRGHGVRYTSAKVVLVGDSGVGKTGLGWRLANGTFKEHESTHGQQFWTVDELRHVREDGTECEAVLWDLAGQPDYRLVHALFLDDADLALVLFDPTREPDPLHDVDYWLKQLRDRDAILIAARADRGSGRLTAEETEAFCAERGVKSFVTTSASTGMGLDQLVAQVRRVIRWDRKPATVTTETFKRIKDHVLSLRENPAQRVIMSPAELRGHLQREAAIESFSDAEMLTAVGHLSNHGYVSRLTTSDGETRILLAPELLNNVAASIVLEARRNPMSLGSLEEQRVLADEYSFRELENVDGPDRELLLDSAVAMFLARNVCLRETDPLTSRAYLVFPELINIKKPDIQDERALEDDVAYTVTGALENVYASLVVLLGYTTLFARTQQWRDQAEYAFGDDVTCGFRLETGGPGRLDLVLYYGENVGQPIRHIFQGLFESFLSRRDVEVRRYEPVACANAHQLNRAVLRELVDAGETIAYCNRCGQKLELAPAAGSVERPGKFAGERRIAGERTRFEQVLFRLSAHVMQRQLSPPECFISYAWGESEQERWVLRLAEDLTKAGLPVVLDRWENSRIGSSVPRFVERVDRADRVLVIGTPEYRHKYDHGDPMRPFVAAAERDLIGKRMVGSEATKETVVPVLLAGDRASFPPLLHPRVHADFRDPDRYFATLLDLVLSLYELDPRDKVSVELRSLLRSGSAA